MIFQFKPLETFMKVVSYIDAEIKTYVSLENTQKILKN